MEPMDYFSDNDVKPNISHSSNSDSHTMSRSGYSLQGEYLQCIYETKQVEGFDFHFQQFPNQIPMWPNASKDTQGFEKNVLVVKLEIKKIC